MRRRWILAIELVLLAALCLWMGSWLLGSSAPRPDDGVSVKIQLAGARDGALLHRDADGSLLYRVQHFDGTYDDLTPEQVAQRVHADSTSRSGLEQLLNVSSPLGLLWVGIGLLGQVLFTGRMIVQWIVSEKEKRSVVPPVFWWMSLSGSTMLLVYFIWRHDPVGVLGQATGWFIYVRNLWMIHRPAPPASAEVDQAEEPVPPRVWRKAA